MQQKYDRGPPRHVYKPSGGHLSGVISNQRYGDYGLNSLADVCEQSGALKHRYFKASFEYAEMGLRSRRVTFVVSLRTIATDLPHGSSRSLE